MKTTPTALLRRAGAGVSVGALVTASVLLATPAQASSGNHVVTPSHVDQSDTRSAGHNDFTDDGVHVYTDNASSEAKAAGYFNVNKSLASVGEPDLAWVPAGGSTAVPGTQLVVDFDHDGKADGILVGEPADYQVIGGNHVPDWWASNGSDAFVKSGAPSQNGDVDPGGSGSAYHGTLDQWRARFANAQVISTGWSLGSGVKGDGTIYSISLGADTYFPSAGAPQTTTKLYQGDVDLTSTRAHGHNVFRPTSGVRVYTDGSTDTDGTVNTDKAAGYFPISGSLQDVGFPSLTFANTSGGAVVGSQTEVDLDGDGTPDGTLVGEPLYAPLFWLSKFSVNGAHTASDAIKAAVPRKPNQNGAPGYSNGAGTMAEWNAAFPNAKVTQGGWSLGSGAKGDGIVTAITYGSTKYTFTGANVAPTASDVTANTAFDTAKTVTLNGADKNADPLTYTASGASHGTVVISGDQATFSPATGYAGPAGFTYTADDGNGDGTASATVSLTVAKAASSVAVTSHTTSFRNTTVTATVSATGAGAVVDGGTVTVKDGSTTVGTGTVAAGKFAVSLGKLPAGSHAYTASFSGTSNAAASSGTLTVTIGSSSLALASNTTKYHNTYVTVTVTATSGSTEGAVVTVKEGTKTLGTASVTGGVAKVSVGKLTKGKHTFTASFPGTTTVAPSSSSATFTIA